MNKEESDLIIAEQNKSTEEILKAVAKVKSDYHELCKLKDKRIAELEDKLALVVHSEVGEMKVKRLKKLIENISDDVDVYFMFGINEKYEDKENGVFTLKENGECSYFEKKLIFTLKEIKEK